MRDIHIQQKLALLAHFSVCVKTPVSFSLANNTITITPCLEKRYITFLPPTLHQMFTYFQYHILLTDFSALVLLVLR